ncbi:MAG: hypothetical protein F4Y96_07980 [Chloroflexi bacterium]|nr:hypothetical protein [Chloroflexota bacterium]
MSYYVYIDDPTNRARVHAGACGHCNYGQGKKDHRLPDNRWEGPFKDREAAWAAVIRAGKRDVGKCPCVARRLN